MTDHRGPGRASFHSPDGAHLPPGPAGGLARDPISDGSALALATIAGQHIEMLMVMSGQAFTPELRVRAIEHCDAATGALSMLYIYGPVMHPTHATIAKMLESLHEQRRRIEVWRPRVNLKLVKG